MGRELAIAVVHGMGSAPEHYSVEFKQLVTQSYVRLGGGRSADDLIWQEIWWGDLVAARHNQIVKAVNYRNDLAYPTLRQMFIDYLGTSLAYQPISGEPLYGAVHARIRAQLAKLAHHRRVDPERTPLVVLGHSLGSVIMSNYICDLQRAQSERDGEVSNLNPFEQFCTLAGFISFGSPLAIFAEQVGTFNKAMKVAGPRLSAAMQARVRWLNFYDKDDIIAYPLRAINDTYREAVSEDIEINVGSAATSWNPACHNGYWEDPDFYLPVARYLGELSALAG